MVCIYKHKGAASKEGATADHGTPYTKISSCLHHLNRYNVLNVLLVFYTVQSSKSSLRGEIRYIACRSTLS